MILWLIAAYCLLFAGLLLALAAVYGWQLWRDRRDWSDVRHFEAWRKELESWHH